MDAMQVGSNINVGLKKTQKSLNPNASTLQGLPDELKRPDLEGLERVPPSPETTQIANKMIEGASIKETVDGIIEKKVSGSRLLRMGARFLSNTIGRASNMLESLEGVIQNAVSGKEGNKLNGTKILGDVIKIVTEEKNGADPFVYTNPKTKQKEELHQVKFSETTSAEDINSAFEESPIGAKFPKDALLETFQPDELNQVTNALMKRGVLTSESQITPRFLSSPTKLTGAIGKEIGKLKISNSQKRILLKELKSAQKTPSKLTTEEKRQKLNRWERDKFQMKRILIQDKTLRTGKISDKALIRLWDKTHKRQLRKPLFSGIRKLIPNPPFRFLVTRMARKPVNRLPQELTFAIKKQLITGGIAAIQKLTDPQNPVIENAIARQVVTQVNKKLPTAIQVQTQKSHPLGDLIPEYAALSALRKAQNAKNGELPATCLTAFGNPGDTIESKVENLKQHLEKLTDKAQVKLKTLTLIKTEEGSPVSIKIELEAVKTEDPSPMPIPEPSQTKEESKTELPSQQLPESQSYLASLWGSTTNAVSALTTTAYNMTSIVATTAYNATAAVAATGYSAASSAMTAIGEYLSPEDLVAKLADQAEKDMNESLGPLMKSPIWDAEKNARKMPKPDTIDVPTSELDRITNPNLKKRVLETLKSKMETAGYTLSTEDSDSGPVLRFKNDTKLAPSEISDPLAAMISADVFDQAGMISSRLFQLTGYDKDYVSNALSTQLGAALGTATEKGAKFNMAETLSSSGSSGSSKSSGSKPTEVQSLGDLKASLETLYTDDRKSAYNTALEQALNDLNGSAWGVYLATHSVDKMGIKSLVYDSIIKPLVDGLLTNLIDAIDSPAFEHQLIQMTSHLIQDTVNNY